MKLEEVVKFANTGADAIKRAPIVSEDTGVKCLRIGDVSQKRPYYEWGNTKISDEDYEKYKLEVDDIIIARTGNTIGVNCIVDDNFNAVYNNGLIRIKADIEKIISRYLWYLIRGLDCQNYIQSIAFGTSTQPNMKIKDFLKYEFTYLELPVQERIVSIIDSIDKKIKNNTEINDNLLQQAQALYREMFVSATNDQRRECRAEEYFDIAIGKTPPRKEHQWFTTNPTDVTWVSISDMGSCGTYISKSSEQLTQEAVDKFNIKVIPSNTVLLSFKLTVGRIAITHGEMTTNEAIAHFKTDKPFINEYLYCYLKDFNYQTMGSTSSIATAVNSKIIKAMPFIIPADEEISRFHSVAGPMFEQILNNQLENDSLAEMRDTLLPKLMSGELDVSNHDI